MNASWLGNLVPGGLAVVGGLLIVAWMNTRPPHVAPLRVPGMDGRDRALGSAEIAPPEAGEPVFSDGRPSQAIASGSWPCFRGPNRDGIGVGSVALARKWPDRGPQVLWTVELGPGHAGAAVADGRLFVLDYDVEAQADTMRCLSPDDGKEIWRNAYPVELVEWHGMSRTVPAVADGRVVSLGPKCHVACWDTQSGECRWIIDLAAQYQATVPQWYAGQCPLIDQGRVILAPSGTSFMIAVDLESGDVVWESKKVSNWEMTHSSIAIMELAGRRAYLYCGSRGVAAVAADDGSILWDSTEWAGTMATCPTPVVVDERRVFFCAGYAAGSLMMQFDAGGGAVAAQPLFRLAPERFEAEQHTPILYEGHLFGARTKAGGNQLVCLDLEGNEVWNSGTDKFERGPYLIADGLIFAMDSRGLLTLAEASVEAYKPLDKFQVFDDGHDAWGPMALVEGRLFVRDLTRMACLDVAEK
jgi:outer membrane protein assembly factor BamB